MSSFASDVPIELLVVQDPDHAWYYTARWHHGEVCRLLNLEHVPEIWLDLIPFMAARILLSEGYNAERRFIVRLQGADYELMRSTLGAAAATPRVNDTAPVKEALRCVFSEGQRHGC